MNSEAVNMLLGSLVDYRISTTNYMEKNRLMDIEVCICFVSCFLTFVKHYTVNQISLHSYNKYSPSSVLYISSTAETSIILYTFLSVMLIGNSRFQLLPTFIFRYESLNKNW